MASLEATKFHLEQQEYRALYNSLAHFGGPSARVVNLGNTTQIIDIYKGMIYGISLSVMDQTARIIVGPSAAKDGMAYFIESFSARTGIDLMKTRAELTRIKIKDEVQNDRR